MSWNLNDLRDRVYPIIDPITHWLVRRGVHPNLITSSGFAVTILAGFMYGIDHVRIAGLLVLLGGAHDIFDGRVARLSGLQSKFGAFYDSVLDRISEVTIYIGLISLYNQYEMSLLIRVLERRRSDWTAPSASCSERSGSSFWAWGL